jgi:hypothetical protein
MELNLSLSIEARTMTDGEGRVLLGSFRGVVVLRGATPPVGDALLAQDTPEGNAETLLWQTPDSHPFRTEREAVIATYNVFAAQMARIFTLG